MRAGLSNSELRIAGFGACMISGYPHKAGGLFEIACGSIEKLLLRTVQSTVVSLGGFPAPRAEKYLARRVLEFNPDYVVIQFASTDAQCPIRKANRSISTHGNLSLSKPGSDSSFQSEPSTLFSPFRWGIASLFGYLLNLDPITPLALHVAAIEKMGKDCRAAGAIPVVLSPFVYGSRYTMRNAITYTNALQDLSEARDMIFIDCLHVLSRLPKRQVLQNDGFHLSLVGHRVVGRAIARSIVADVAKRS